MCGCNWRPLAIFAVLTLLASAAATAQITPGQVQDTLKFPKPTEPAPPPPLVEPPRAAPLPGGAEQRHLTVTGFNFIGNSVFNASELAALLSDYLNHPITLLDLYTAADRVADYYADHGYTLASVNLPPQKILSGVVMLEVSEGHIGAIRVEGNRRYSSARILHVLGDVQSGTVYRSGELERGMRRVTELPGVDARAVVKPGADYGSTDLVVKVAETRVAGAAFADNYGTGPIGEYRGGVNLALNNPIGIGDQLSLLGLHSAGNRLNYGLMTYRLPLNTLGTRLVLAYSYAGFTAQGAVEGSNKNGRATLEHPLLRSGSNRLDLTIGGSVTDSDAALSGGGPLLSGTSITLAEFGAAYNHHYQDAAVTDMALNLATNLRTAESAVEARPIGIKARNAKQRLRLELDAQHNQPLASAFFVNGHVNAIYSPDPLSNVTQFSIGGPQSVRGFPASEARGDRGFFGQATLGRNFDLGPTRLAPRIFGDAGKVFCAKPAADCISQRLSSAGVGADFYYSRYTVKLDYSRPIRSPSASDSRDGRLFGSVFVGF